jgi:calcineurin-like phosphoesterase family protein
MNYRKPIFFTSDWHLGHENSIKFDNRPFVDLEHMHRELIRRFNVAVPKNAVTYFLGDIAMGSVEVAKQIIPQLNGTKVIIVGNHDRPANSLYNIGFHVVLNNATIYIHNQKVTLSHCPLPGIPRENMSEYPNKGINWHGEYKNQAFTVANEGQFHLHGHIHSPNNGKSVKIQDRQYDVGVPANKYTPVHINHIESWIMKTLKEEAEGNL